MSLRIQRNVEHVFVPTDVSITSSKGGKNISELNTGEIFVCSPGGTCLDTSSYSSYENFKIGYKNSDGHYVISDNIPMRTLRNYTGKVSAAAAEQIDYIGYNGTSGSLDAIDSNLYLVRLWFQGDTEAQFSEQKVKHGVYMSDSSATQQEVAAGLTENLISNLNGVTDGYNVKAERVYSGAQDDAISTYTVSVTNGSKSIKFSGDASSIVTAGSILRIGGSGAGTDPCYVVSSHDSGSGADRIYTLDVPYQGSTATVAHGNVETVATGGNWGIKLTGIARTWALGKFPWSKVRWDLELQDFGTSDSDEKSTSASLGLGTYQQIAEAEWFAQGNEGGDLVYRSRSYAPVTAPRSDYVVDDYYSILTFDYDHEMTTDLGKSNTSPKSILMALNVGSTAAANISATSFTDSSTDGFMEVMDAIAANSSNYSNSAQLSNV